MILKINLQKIKLIYTPQGEYLKTIEPCKYLVCRLPDEYKIEKNQNYVTIEVDERFYRDNRLYRFEDYNLE